MRCVIVTIAIFTQTFLLVIDAAYADTAWIFGMHDNGGGSVAIARGKQFWGVMTESIGVEFSSI